MTKIINDALINVNQELKSSYIEKTNFNNGSLMELEKLMESYLRQSKLEDIDFQLLFNFLLIEMFPKIEDFESALFYIKIVLNKVNFENQIINKEIWILFILNIYTESWVGISLETKNIFDKFLNYYDLIDKDISSMVFYEFALYVDDFNKKEILYKKSISLNNNIFNSYIALADLYSKKTEINSSKLFALKALSKITKVTDIILYKDLINIHMFLELNITGNWQDSYSYRTYYNKYFLEELK